MFNIKRLLNLKLIDLELGVQFFFVHMLKKELKYVNLRGNKVPILVEISALLIFFFF